MTKKSMNKLWIGLAVLSAVTPLGLLATGTAFGEWGSVELQNTLGYVPEGIKNGETLWHALFSNYNVLGFLGKSFFHSSIGYIMSAALGILMIYIVMLALGKSLAEKEDEGNENS